MKRSHEQFYYKLGEFLKLSFTNQHGSILQFDIFYLKKIKTVIQLIIILMNLIFRRTIKATNFQNKFWCSLSSCQYPYKFGGVQQKRNSIAKQKILKSLYGDNVIEGFKQAYLAILTSLRDKDKRLLLQTMQPSLTKSLKFQEVQLVNEGSPIQVNIANFYGVAGCEFIRTPQSRNVQKMTSQKITFQVPNDLFNLSEVLISKQIQQSILSGSFPILIGFEVYFTSKAKLIKKNQKDKAGKTQCHMIQFETFNKHDMEQIIKILQQMSPLFNGSGMNDLGKIIGSSPFLSSFDWKQFLIPKNYEWKISDMDLVLNRNFKIV